MRTRLPVTIVLLALLAACTYWAFESSQLYVLRAGVAGSLKYNLLVDTAVLAIPVAALLGVSLGAYKYAKDHAKITDGKNERHDEIMFFQHWSNALGMIILIITGFVLGALFIPRTVQVVEQIGFALNLHFIGILFFFIGASYYITKGLFTGEIKHMMPFGGMTLKGENFLGTERFVFPMWSIGLSGIVLTGIFKIGTHVWSLPGGLMGVMTYFHRVFAIYMAFILVAHIFAATVLPASRRLFRLMITSKGKVTEEYVQHHHER